MKKNDTRIYIQGTLIVILYLGFVISFSGVYTGSQVSFVLTFALMTFGAVCGVIWPIYLNTFSISDSGLSLLTLNGKIRYRWDEIDSTVKFKNKYFIFVTVDHKNIKLFQEVYGLEQTVKYLEIKGYTVDFNR